MPKNNMHRRRMDHVSEQAHYYTHGELTCARLKLASEMLTLVQADRQALPPALQTGVAGAALLLGEVLALARRLA